MPDRPASPDVSAAVASITDQSDTILAHLASASIDELLDALRHFADMDVAFVGEFSSGRRIVRFVGGDGHATALLNARSDDVVDTYCSIVAERDAPSLFPDVQTDSRLATLDITTLLGIGSYIGVPVRLSSGRMYGTLCAYSHQPVPAFSPEVGAVFTVLASLVARRLEMPENSYFDAVATQERVRMVIADSAFHVVYQPIVDLRSGDPAGYEALSRFPGETSEGPEAWFADAHRVGLGPELELAAVSRALAAVDQLDPSVYVAVNMAVPAVNSDLAVTLLEGAPTSRLVIELTEHDRAPDHALAAARTRINELGARIAVDDLGAGFAGLSRIVQLQPDIIKLDRFLTLGISADPCRHALATATASFCDAVGAVLVAEGVETHDDLEALMELGAHFAQGYLLGRPGPIPT